MAKRPSDCASYPEVSKSQKTSECSNDILKQIVKETSAFIQDLPGNSIGDLWREFALETSVLTPDQMRKFWNLAIENNGIEILKKVLAVPGTLTNNRWVMTTEEVLLILNGEADEDYKKEPPDGFEQFQLYKVDDGTLRVEMVGAGNEDYSHTFTDEILHETTIRYFKEKVQIGTSLVPGKNRVFTLDQPVAAVFTKHLFAFQ
jgi:hypothetical protein